MPAPAAIAKPIDEDPGKPEPERLLPAPLPAPDQRAFHRILDQIVGQRRVAHHRPRHPPQARDLVHQGLLELTHRLSTRLSPRCRLWHHGELARDELIETLEHAGYREVVVVEDDRDQGGVLRLQATDIEVRAVELEVDIRTGEVLRETLVTEPAVTGG